MIRPIKSEEQYELVLQQIFGLMQKDLAADSVEADESEMLSILVKEYELKHYPVPKPHPIEAIKFRLDQMNVPESELSRLLGNKSRKSDILSGRRKLNLNMIRKLHKELNIPAEILIRDY